MTRSVEFFGMADADPYFFLIIVTGDETWRFLYDPKHTSVLWMENKNISTGKVKFRFDKNKGEFRCSFWIRNVWFTMGLFQRVKLCVEILWPLRDAIRMTPPEQLVEKFYFAPLQRLNICLFYEHYILFHFIGKYNLFNM